MESKNKPLPVIEVKNLSKKYIISHEQKAEYGSLRDSIVAFFKRPFEKRGQNLGADQKKEEFWALKDVSFEVNKGEIFGVIGRNGSGKSTLLKTLSRIISPTSGEAIIRGTTASLLEVGTGFHPELTGRENVFFNGSMLGMSRDEIGKKFDEIVKFAEIEKFLDTPVKFYSSGMYVRLAFSVAAHLEPDVLILDEVLAVGDEAFQKKSMKRILSTIQNGTTVLFVSHSMDAIKKICSRGILLDKGQVDFYGSTSELVERYNIQNISEREKQSKSTRLLKPETADFLTIEDMVVQEDGVLVDATTVKSDSTLLLNIKFSLDGPVSHDFLIGYAIKSEGGSLLYSSYNGDTANLGESTLESGEYYAQAEIPSSLLNEGVYKISVIASIFNEKWLFDYNDDQVPSIYLTVDKGLSHEKLWPHAREGYLSPKIEWTVKEHSK